MAEIDEKFTQSAHSLRTQTSTHLRNVRFCLATLTIWSTFHLGLWILFGDINPESFRSLRQYFWPLYINPQYYDLSEFYFYVVIPWAIYAVYLTVADRKQSKPKTKSNSQFPL